MLRVLLPPGGSTYATVFGGFVAELDDTQAAQYARFDAGFCCYAGHGLLLCLKS
jgi:phosphatidylserine decarboxylase